METSLWLSRLWIISCVLFGFCTCASFICILLLDFNIPSPVGDWINWTKFCFATQMVLVLLRLCLLLFASYIRQRLANDSFFSKIEKTWVQYSSKIFLVLCTLAELVGIGLLVVSWVEEDGKLKNRSLTLILLTLTGLEFLPFLVLMVCSWTWISYLAKNAISVHPTLDRRGGGGGVTFVRAWL